MIRLEELLMEASVPKDSRIGNLLKELGVVIIWFVNDFFSFFFFFSFRFDA